jgi:hypothetical protein
MKKLFVTFAFLGLMVGGAHAGAVLGTSNPAGTPLITDAGAVSGPMFVNVSSNNPPNDIMSGWNFTLKVAPETGASGTLTFQDPGNGPAPIPPSYIFGGDSIGITAVNGGNQLGASDFFDTNIGNGVAVPGTPGSNLLQMDFLASSNALGLFGVYALEGAPLTEWTDGNSNPQLFTNVPNGTGMVLIGEVLILGSVPEPSSFVLLALGCTALAGWQWRRHRKGVSISSPS